MNKSMQHNESSIQLGYIGLLIVPICTVWGNVLVCVSVYIERRLRSRFNYFLVSLAVSDLMCAVLVMPVSAINMIRGTAPPAGICLAWYSLDVFFTATTIIHLCSISLDRYLVLNDPLRQYHNHHTRNRRGRHASDPSNPSPASSSLMLRIFLAWLVPFCIACPLFLLALHLDSTPALPSQSFSSPLNLTSSDVSYKGCGPNNAYFVVIAVVVTFVLPLCIMCITYVLTVHSIVRQTRQARQHLYPPGSDGYHGNNSNSKNKKNREFQSSDENTSASICTVTGRGSFCLKGFSSSQISIDTPSIRVCNDLETHNNHSSSQQNCYNQFLSVPDHSNAMVTRMSYDQLHVTPGNHTCTTSVSPQNHPLLSTPRRYPSLLTLRRVHSLCSSTHGTKKINGERSGSSKMIRHNSSQRFRSAKRTLAAMSSGRKAVQVLGILFALFLLCYLPFFVVYLLDFFCAPCRTVTTQLVPHTEWVAYCASMLNPIVYHVFNPTFRNTFNRLMRGDCYRVRKAYPVHRPIV